MVVTDDVDLPTIEELTVDEVNVSTVTLMAAAPYLGKLCENVNNEFMLCRQESDDARACVQLGKQVTNCTMKAFENIKTHCCAEFKQYSNCVEQSSGDYGYRHCRNTQEVFDKCMDLKVCVLRPHYGYFTRGRVHETMMPHPPAPPCPCETKYKDATPSLPDCKERKPPRFGSRYFWVLE